MLPDDLSNDYDKMDKFSNYFDTRDKLSNDNDILDKFSNTMHTVLTSTKKSCRDLMSPRQHLRLD